MVYLGAGLITAALGKYQGREHREEAHFTGHICQLCFGQWFGSRKHHNGLGETMESQKLSDISQS